MDYLKDMKEMTEKQQEALFNRLIMDIMKHIVQLWKEHDDYECSPEGEEEFIEHFVLEGQWYEDEDNGYENTFQKAIDWYDFPNEQHYKDNIDIIKKFVDKHNYYVMNEEDVKRWDLSLEETLVVIAHDRKEMLNEFTGGKINTEILAQLHTIPKL